MSCIIQSRIEGKIEVAKAMLAEGMDATTIAKVTGLSTDEIDVVTYKLSQFLKSVQNKMTEL